MRRAVGDQLSVRRNHPLIVDAHGLADRIPSRDEFHQLLGRAIDLPQDAGMLPAALLGGVAVITHCLPGIVDADGVVLCRPTAAR